MEKFRETVRYLALWFAIGFILGSLMDCTIHRSLNVNMVVSCVWGAGTCLVILLVEKVVFNQIEKQHMREEEVERVVDVLNAEISDIKRKIPEMLARKDIDMSALYGIYLDRIVYLEKLKTQVLATKRFVGEDAEMFGKGQPKGVIMKDREISTSERRSHRRKTHHN